MHDLPGVISQYRVFSYKNHAMVVMANSSVSPTSPTTNITHYLVYLFDVSSNLTAPFATLTLSNVKETKPAEVFVSP